MDIDSLYTKAAHEEGAEIEILSPSTGQPTDFFVTILGPDSKRWRAKHSEYMQRLLAAKADKAEIDTDQSEAEFFASVTLGWRGLERSGKEVEFSFEEAAALYINAPNVRDQINIFAGNRANFIKG